MVGVDEIFNMLEIIDGLVFFIVDKGMFDVLFECFGVVLVLSVVIMVMCLGGRIV